jgi:hypothetical protein
LPGPRGDLWDAPVSVHRVSAAWRACPVLAKVPKRFGGLGTASDDQGRSFFPREAASPQRMDAPGAELRVGGQDQPTPAVGLLRMPDARSSPPKRLFEEAEGVL